MIDVKSYKDNGYLLVKGLFRRPEIDLIREEAKQVFIAQMRRLNILQAGDVSEATFERGMAELFDADLQTFTNCGKQVQHLISLHRLSLDERIIRAIVELGLEFPNVSTRPVMYFNSRRLAKKEVYWRLSTHQDWRSMQGSLDAMVVWLPLVDIDRSLGALEIVPGSHKMGLLQSEMVDGYGHIEDPMSNVEPLPVEVEAGDALFFSAFLVHQSGTNVTESIRWSCHFRYNNLRERTFIDRGFPHPYIYKPQEELITKNFPPRAQVVDTFRV
jgi:ectoine hydroxylase-related dioxygenase (phytanoyl-CoA dioxygenase family)